MGGAVISAQPRLRNMTAEVTKFLPTSLRVRRDQPKPNKAKLTAAHVAKGRVQPQRPVALATRGGGVIGGRGGMHGDAYDTFMKEMEGFL